jgi:hypothetical protein
MPDVGVNIQIRDDRGRLSDVTGKANTELWILKESVRGGSIYREARRWSWANVGWLLLACAIAAVAGRFLLAVFPGPRTVMATPLLAAIAYVIMRFTRYNAARKRALQQQVRQVLRSGVCPACDYPLRGIPPASDGCTLCPECAAAWRLDSESPRA